MKPQNEALIAFSPESGLFPIGAVSSITGVAVVTLRAWERRYGLLKPLRKASGHRLYSRADIDRVIQAVALLDKGMRIGQVRDELAALSAKQESRHASSPWEGYRQSMISAVVRFDEENMDQVYNEVLSLYRPEIVTQNLIVPLLLELGTRWKRERLSVAEEHFFSFYLRNKLGTRFDHRSRNSSGSRVLAACLPGEYHEIPLILFGLAAQEAGYRPVMLGADLPLKELPAVAAKTGSKAIVLSGSVRPAPGVLENDVAAIVTATRLPIAVGGETSIQCRDAVHKAGAHSLGGDTASGLVKLTALIADNGARSRV